MRVSCLCGCGRWWYHTRRGAARPFADLDCWIRAELKGLAERSLRRKLRSHLRLTRAGREALAARARGAPWECECGDPSPGGPHDPCTRCAKLEGERAALAPRESRDQSAGSEQLARRRHQRRERYRAGRDAAGGP